MNDATKELVEQGVAPFCPNCQPIMRAFLEQGLQGMADGTALRDAHDLGIPVKVRIDAPEVRR
ncbi:MAG: hypothetical protein WC876_09120 [Candidatus Thermoplasmatota archaeon]|jgi:hypothetical protein